MELESKTNKKYKLLKSDFIKINGVKVFRIKSLQDIKNQYGHTVVKKGDKGGYIKSESNLSISGSAWVYGDAQVYGNAQVSGSAWVSGNAQVSGSAWVYGGAQVYGNAQVSGGAQVSGNAQVSGGARVSGNAQVSGSAWVYGGAQVSGGARVSGSAWVYGGAQVSGGARVSGNAQVYGGVISKIFPFYTGTKHSVCLCKPDFIKIGCYEFSINYWLDNYQNIGKQNNYTDEQIKEYKVYIDLLKSLHDKVFIPEEQKAGV